jgi:hypothetical protein
MAGAAARRTRRIRGRRFQAPLPLQLLDNEGVVHGAGQRGMGRVGSHGCVLWRIAYSSCVSTPTKKQMPQRNQVLGRRLYRVWGWDGDWVVITTALEGELFESETDRQTGERQARPATACSFNV